VAALGLGAHLALSLFGAGYASAATVPLVLLVIGYLPALPKVYYVAVCRATGRIWRAAIVLTAFAAAEIAAAAAGGAMGGLLGLSVAVLAVATIEGLATAPAVLKVYRMREPARPVPGRAATEADDVGRSAGLLCAPSRSPAKALPCQTRTDLISNWPAHAPLRGSQ
jgi:hypothetical protein